VVGWLLQPWVATPRWGASNSCDAASTSLRKWVDKMALVMACQPADGCGATTARSSSMRVLGHPAPATGASFRRTTQPLSTIEASPPSDSCTRAPPFGMRGPFHQPRVNVMRQDGRYVGAGPPQMRAANEALATGSPALQFGAFDVLEERRELTRRSHSASQTRALGCIDTMTNRSVTKRAAC